MIRLAPLRGVEPDPLAIERHLGLLFGYLDGFVPLRLFSEIGTPEQAANNTFHPVQGAAAAVQQAAARAAEQGRGVFVVPGVVAVPGRAKAEDVVASGALLIDLDHGDIAAKRDHLQRYIGPTSLIVASGGRTEEGQDKLHLYWRLSEPAQGEDLAQLVAQRALIARKVGGDTSFGSAHQPIRVAGTIHGKHGVLTLVRILEASSLEYELSDLADRVEEMPVTAGQEARRISSNCGPGLSAADLMTRRVRAGGLDPETRYSALSKIIGHWVRQVRSRRMSLEQAWQAVAEHNLAMILPPWHEERLKREFLAIVRLDEQRNGPLPDDDQATPASMPPLSDDGLAAAFVERHRDEWRYVPAWGCWMRWTGTHWRRDETLAIREAVRQVCRSAITPDTTPGEAKRVASEKTMRAVERIAASDPAIARGVYDWDADPVVLNTPSGILDLETGELMLHQPGRMLTQMTSCSVGKHCPRWVDFIAEITGGDEALAGYLARLSGYCLTASTEEHVFAFLYGTGANGKSVFLQTISSVLGSYAATAPLGAFTSTRNEPHPTDLAGLVGKRLVSVSETEAGRAWAESRIKTVTGGDPVRARFMHRDFFEFTPTFKLLIAGNHRPRLTGVGEAMRRRLHLIPFTVTIPAEKRDRQLTERLAAERDGILGWMLDGYTEWRRIGSLAPPQSVLQSAQSYFEDEDLVGQWINECCSVGPIYRATAQQLFNSWSAWAASTGTEVGSQKTLGDALRERGHQSGKVMRGRGWHGISIRSGGSDDRAVAE